MEAVRTVCFRLSVFRPAAPHWFPQEVVTGGFSPPRHVHANPAA